LLNQQNYTMSIDSPEKVSKSLQNLSIIQYSERKMQSEKSWGGKGFMKTIACIDDLDNSVIWSIIISPGDKDCFILRTFPTNQWEFEEDIIRRRDLETVFSKEEIAHLDDNCK